MILIVSGIIIDPDNLLFNQDDNCNTFKIPKPKYLKYMDKNVIGFEPRLALDGGLEGLLVIQKVIKKSSKLIKKNGILVLEMAFDQKDKVMKILKKEGFYINKIIKDLANKDRCIAAVKI